MTLALIQLCFMTLPVSACHFLTRLYRSGWDGLPICSLMAAEGYRAMYVAPPQGSYEGRAGEYFQAVCVKGGDVLEDEGCFCAGVATPMLGGGNVCEMKDGAAWCWTAPGTCADGERSRF